MTREDLDGDELDFDLEEMPTPKGNSWALDVHGTYVAPADKSPEVLKAALDARLKRIDQARDRDPWGDLDREIAAVSRRVSESAGGVDVPIDATHKIVGGLFADTYAKDPRVTEDGKAFYVTLASGLRRGMMTRVDFDQFTKVDGLPDYKLRSLLSGAVVKGEPRTTMGANKLRKK